MCSAYLVSGPLIKPLGLNHQALCRRLREDLSRIFILELGLHDRGERARDRGRDAADNLQQ